MLLNILYEQIIIHHNEQLRRPALSKIRELWAICLEEVRDFVKSGFQDDDESDGVDDFELEGGETLDEAEKVLRDMADGSLRLDEYLEEGKDI